MNAGAECSEYSRPRRRLAVLTFFAYLYAMSWFALRTFKLSNHVVLSSIKIRRRCVEPLMHARIPGGKGLFRDLLQRAPQVDKIHLFLSTGVGILLA